MQIIKLRPEVSAALGEWNKKHTGRGVDSTGYVTDPEVIARLEALALPNENLNDTIMRWLNGSATASLN